MNAPEGTPRPSKVSPGVLAAAAVVSVIALLGAYLVISNGQDSPSEPAASAPDATNSAAPAAPRDDSVCGLKTPAKDTPLLTAPDTKWELINYAAIPSVEGAGPGIVKDGVRSCFARSRTGALLAAANIYSWNPYLDPKALATCCIAAGAGRDAYVREAASANPPTSRTGPSHQFAGFQIRAYDGDSAAVVLGFRHRDGAFAEHLVDLVWEEGDWKLLLADGGSYRSMPRAIPDLTGFIPWAGA